MVRVRGTAKHLLVSAVLLALTACGGGGETAPEGDVPPTETAVVPTGGFGEEDEIELAIEDYETADIIGTAILGPAGATSTRVAVQLDAYPEGGGSAEIRSGECEGPDAEVAHELGELEEGRAEATVDQSLENLMAAPNSVFAVGPGGDDLGCALIAPFGTDVD